MSLDTLLEAAKYLEKSGKATSKDDTAIPRANQSGSFCERRRAISECDHERRRRPGGAGTRETHNKLEKNRRAHLKECFEFLKKQVPNLEEKKTSNLNILRGALKYIQTLKKSDSDQTAERDLLTISNNMMKKRIEVLRNEIESQPLQGRGVPVVDKAVTPSSAVTKENIVESRMSPVSVATQTSFNPGEGEASAPRLEKSNGDVSEKINGILDDVKTENGLETECQDDDENEVIDVENDDTDIGTESREMAEKGELVTTNEEEVPKDSTKGGEMETKLDNGKVPNGVMAFDVGKASSRKRPHPDDEAEQEREEEKNAKIKGCARVSC